MCSMSPTHHKKIVSPQRQKVIRERLLRVLGEQQAASDQAASSGA